MKGSYLLHMLLNSQADADNQKDNTQEQQLEVVVRTIQSQVYVLKMNVLVLFAAAGTMGISSLLFMLGKKKDHSETRHLLSNNV